MVSKLDERSNARTVHVRCHEVGQGLADRYQIVAQDRFKLESVLWRARNRQRKKEDLG